MAVKTTIGGGGSLFIGEDKTIRLGPLYLATDPTVGVDMTGWTMVFDVRKHVNSSTAVLSVTPLSLTGVFNILQSSNTQRAIVPLTDTQLNLFQEQTYTWSWKRTDDGNETVLGWGDFIPQKASAP